MTVTNELGFIGFRQRATMLVVLAGLVFFGQTGFADEKAKLSDDPTKIVTKIGVSYTGTGSIS